MSSQSNVTCYVTGAVSETEFVKELFANYNKDVKSTKDASTQTMVYLAYELAKIGGIVRTIFASRPLS